MKKEMVGGELVAALQKRGKAGEELEVALLKRDGGTPGGGTEAGREGGITGGGMPGGGTLVGRAGGITGGAMTAAIQEGALLVKVAASENMGQKEVALTYSPYTGSSHSEMN